MDIFNGTHIIRVTRNETMADGFRVQIAMADSSGNPIGPFTADSTKLYGGNWRARKIEIYAEIIRHLLP